ncbi:MAG TPA: glycoside hydrolase domain-containing protein, partial [Bacteroidota bacterium]|nr:glycoside hydrolase domain-containing protein [Bacteroidota bacterium]
MRIPILLIAISPTVVGSTASSQVNYTRFVNPFVGTDAHGHTFPGATVPFGMVQLSPDTRVEGWDACSGYHYSDSTLLGFSHTHLSGTGIADYGDILFLPIIGKPQGKKPTSFNHADESASPGYYRVKLPDGNILVELTTTKRVGVHRYTFPKTREAFVVIDLKHGLGPDRVLESRLEFTSDQEVAGYRRSEGWAKDQHLYFVARFSKSFTVCGFVDSLREGRNLVGEGRKVYGGGLVGYVQFSTAPDERIVIKVGISSVSIDGARSNLDAEMPHWDFEQARHEAEQAWSGELGKIEVEGGTEEQQKTFYTAL